MANRPSRFLGMALSVLSLTATFLTGAGLIMAAALKNSNLADRVLSLDPHYALAMEGLHVLQDLKYPLRTGPDTTDNVAVLTITDPAWSVILDFTKSETAIRKSERNLPSPPVPPPAPATSPSGPTADVASPLPAGMIPIANFERAKTIVAIRINVASAGDQPLAPPYRLLLISPAYAFPQIESRRVYEFLSFEEFRLDLRQVALDEMEEWSLWLAVIAFAFNLPIEALRRIISAAEQSRLLMNAAGATGTPPAASQSL